MSKIFKLTWGIVGLRETDFLNQKNKVEEEEVVVVEEEEKEIRIFFHFGHSWLDLLLNYVYLSHNPEYCFAPQHVA